MNCFAHSWQFVDRDPYFVTGTVLPDWLSMIARQTRVRSKAANFFGRDSVPAISGLAHGIIRHHHDDGWFHNNRTFVETNLRFSIELRDLLGSDAGFRPHLVGHITIEMLLDAFLATHDIARLDRFYQIVGQVDPASIQSTVNMIANTPTERIVDFIPRFIDEGYLYDYVDDWRVRYRMNRVLKRIGLAELPPEFEHWLFDARKSVYANALEMLNEPGQKPFIGKS
jgi:hypothetical protein